MCVYEYVCEQENLFETLRKEYPDGIDVVYVSVSLIYIEIYKSVFVYVNVYCM